MKKYEKIQRQAHNTEPVGLLKTSRDRNAAMRKPKDPSGNRERIIEAAAQEFAANGLKGASMDAIAQRTDTARAMINYYFKNKANLYLEVLESVYRLNRTAEANLKLDDLAPAEALTHLIDFTIRYYEAHPEMVRLIASENQAGGTNIRRSSLVRVLNETVLSRLDKLLSRGSRERVFRQGLRAIDLHMMITGLVFFRHANQHTFGYAFNLDLQSPKVVRSIRAMIIDAVLRFVLLEPDKAR